MKAEQKNRASRGDSPHSLCKIHHGREMSKPNAAGILALAARRLLLLCNARQPLLGIEQPDTPSRARSLTKAALSLHL
jgi:hypothetical protein